MIESEMDIKVKKINGIGKNLLTSLLGCVIIRLGQRKGNGMQRTMYSSAFPETKNNFLLEKQRRDENGTGNAQGMGRI